MSHIGATVVTSKPTGALDSSQIVYGLASYLAPDPAQPEYYINVRLTNGAGYYTAGGTTVSGGSALAADQGAPNLLSAAWPVKVTDGINVYGTVSNPFNVTFTSGGLSVGDSARPIWVTGSVYVLNPSGGGAGGNVTVQSGSVIGLLVGGNNVANSNPIPISDANGSITVDGSLIVQSGSLVGLLVSGVPLSLTNPMPITGTVSLSQAVAISSLPNITIQSGSVTGLLIGGQALSNGNPLPITGSVSLTQAVAISSLPNVTVANPQTTVTTVSGSITALMTNGVIVSPNNPLSVTGTISLASVSAVTGALKLTEGIAISSLPNVTVSNPQTTVTTVSGSVSAIMIGGQIVTPANPVPVTGSVTLASISAITGSVSLTQAIAVSSLPNVTIANPQTTVTTVSGSTTALMMGGQVVTTANPLSITGSVSLTSVVAITGALKLTEGVSIASLPAISQGTAASIGAPWPVIVVSGSDAVGTQTHPTWVTGSVYVINQSAGGAASNVTSVSGSVTGLLVGGVALAGNNPLPITGSVSLTQAIAVSSLPNVTIANPQTTVTTVSGSITALMANGVMVSPSNPLSITGSISLSSVSAVTGALKLTEAIAVSSLPNVTIANPQTTVTTVSGSLAGLLYGGVAAGQTNPFWVTGSVYVLNQSAGGTSVTSQSGSVTGLLIGGVALASTNPLPVTGSVSLTQAVAVSSLPNVTVQSGSVTGLLVGGVAVSNANPVPTSQQGTATVTGSVSLTQAIAVSSLPNITVQSGSVTGLLYGGVAAGQTNPLWVTGSVYVLNQSAGGTSVTSQSGSVTGLLYGGVAAGQTNPFWVTGSVAIVNDSPIDASGSVTGLLVGGVALASTNPLPVTGSVSLTQAIAVSSLPNVTVQSGSVTGLLLGGVPVSNAAPIPVSQQGTVTTTSTVVSGSVTGLLVGGVALSSTNQLPITGALGILVGGMQAVETNPLPARMQRSSTATVTSLTASITSQLLKNTNTSRLGMTIYNDSTANAYLKWGGAVATNDFSFKLLPDDYYEVPYGHTGRIDIIHTVATGSTRVTEFT